MSQADKTAAALREPAACYPSNPTRLCEHCARNHAGGELRDPERRFSVVIDASVTLKRRTCEPGCGMFAFPPTFDVRQAGGTR